MKSRVLTAFLVISMALVAIRVVLAQDEAGASRSGSTPIFLPQLYQGAGSDIPDSAQGGDPFAGMTDEDTPAVTEVIVTEVIAVDAGAVADRLPPSLALNRLDVPLVHEDSLSMQKIHPDLRDAQGPRQVVIRLSEQSLAESAASEVSISARDNQRAQLGRVAAQQMVAERTVRAIDADARVLANVQKALNAIVVEMDADGLSELAADPDVVSIHPVVDYELTLGETVPYIGARALQDLGFDGSGVKVAVLDTGIDYTHVNVGGEGTSAAFEAAYGTGPEDPRNTVRPDFFPTERVVDGFDFVGEFWPTLGPLNPNPNPIDVQGHGTHVADILGGANGVAPGVDLYAVKVCSPITLQCSGIATLQALDWVLDPNGDGDLSDRVDIVNMSFGERYGIPRGSLTAVAVDNLNALGILSVAGSGNDGDKPFVTSGPAAVAAALSVAETHAPSAHWSLMEILQPANLAGYYPAIFQPWSVEFSQAVTAPVQYGDGAGGNVMGCEPFPPSSLAGKIVLVDRGECTFSFKIKNIGDGGGLVGIIGLVDPSAPFEAFYSGDAPITIPGFIISQAHATLIKGGLAAGNVLASLDPATDIAVVGTMHGASSRGPTQLTYHIKPEIGAPGASVSAVAGSGSGEARFGGTSGATPMIAGAAALLRQAYPNRSPAEIKSVLMNTAEANIYQLPAELGGHLAPITRIGGGEVRVERALNSPAAAWDAETGGGALSFGFYDITRQHTNLQRMVTVRNYSNRTLHFEIAPSFRFANDAENGAVDLSAPNRISVPAHGQAHFPVSLRIQGEQLRPWSMNSGAFGADSGPLTLLEYDGYLHLNEIGGGASSLHLPWHVLPRQAGDVTLRSAMNQVRLANRGVGTTVVESYSLIGASPQHFSNWPGDGYPTPDLRYVGYATYPVPAGVCSENESYVLAFAMNTWVRQTHAIVPVAFWMELDTNQDGTPDYIVANRDVSVNAFTDGRNLVWVQDNAALTLTSMFYTDHETNSANTVLRICAEQIGRTKATLNQPITMDVYVHFYLGGDFDGMEGITITPGKERYVGQFDQGGVGSTALAPMGMDTLRVMDTGETVNSTETGLLLLYRGGAPEGQEAGIVAVAR